MHDRGEGPGFNGLLGFEPASTNVRDDWLDQSLREVQGAGSRQVIWYFAKQYAAEHAATYFKDEDKGREKIIIKVQPAE